jgi:hypothetical protein
MWVATTMNESLDPDDPVLTGRDVVKHFLRRDVKVIAHYEPLVH